MQEKGEFPPPEEAFRQSLEIARNVSQRLHERQESVHAAGGSTYVRHVWSDPQTLERIEVFELLGATRNTDPADALTMPYKNTLLTCRYWDSTDLETEPVEQQVKTAKYLPLVYTLTIDGFKGRAASTGSVFEPFFELDRCDTTEKKHDLMLAVSATEAENEPEMKRVIRKFRGAILKHYTADEISAYAAIVSDVPRLSDPIRTEKISELATRKIIRDHTRPDASQKGQLTPEQVEESIRTLDRLGLIDENIFGIASAYRISVLSESLHARLHSENYMHMLPVLGRHPTTFIANYMRAILNAHDEKPERRPLTDILPQNARADLSSLITTANAIIAVVNEARGPDCQLAFLHKKALHDIPRALTVILNTTRSGTPEERLEQTQQDSMYIENVSKLLEITARRELGRAAATQSSMTANART